MRIAINNFTGGEVAPSLSARYDLARYKNSVQCMENFLPNVHGNVERRPGTIFVADLGADSVLFPFSFNVEVQQNFIIVLSDKRLRIAQGLTLIDGVDLMTPWALEDLPNLSFAQVGDIVYFAHQKYPLHKVTRSGSTGEYIWDVVEVALNSSLSAPTKPTVTFKGTASGYTLRYKVVAVDENGKESLASEFGEVNAKHPSDWVVGDSATVSWQAVEGAQEYNIYREEAGYYGFIGISEGLSFVDNNYEADISDTPREDWNPFADANNPGIVSFHQQRMVLASTPTSPQAFYMSRIGDFENFRKSRPIQEDDPVEYLIASGNIDSITWAASFGDLLIGTSGSEYKVGGDGNSISASNVSIVAQSYWGSSNLFPIVIGNSILHVQRHGARVRDLFYSLEKDGYAGNDLSIMAPHLFDGYSLRQWAFQQTPFSSIWIVRDDGVLLALTYMKEHDIWGWSRHKTDGLVRSVVTVSGANGDDIYFVINRGGNFYLEKFTDRWREVEGVNNAFFVDCGKKLEFLEPVSRLDGLSHLENLYVAILADGSPVDGLKVKNGAVELPYAVNTAIVGLPYTSTLSPHPSEGDLQNGSSLGVMRGIGKCTLRLESTVGGKYGANVDNLYELPFTPAVWGEAVQPFSGDVECIPGGGQATRSTVWIAQDTPLPFTLSAIVLDVDITG